MSFIEGLVYATISGLIIYLIKKVDSLDHRLDKMSNTITRIIAFLPKRKSDEPHYTARDEGWYSDNSGIEL